MSCQPKGSMCMSCSNGSAACAGRDFGSMPVIQVYPDGVTAVKCKYHRAAALDASKEVQAAKWAELAQQPEHAQSQRGISCGAKAPDHLMDARACLGGIDLSEWPKRSFANRACIGGSSPTQSKI